MAIVDLSNLGERDKKEIQYKSVNKITSTEGRVGVQETVVLTKEVQPVLNEAEVKQLGDDVEWKDSPECFKPYGKYMCMAGGRRFFTDFKYEKPKLKAEPKGKSDKKES